MSQLTYRPLTPNLHRIRLVQIFQAEEAQQDTSGDDKHSEPVRGDSKDAATLKVPPDHVRCTISHVSLEDAPPYQALSYTWGPPLLQTPITANGQISLVTRDLENALRHLRSDGETVTAWIDALCINQRDDVEKSQQVAQMRRIYTQARSVRSWLGSAADDSDVAMAWIREFGQRAYDLKIGSTPELLLRNLLGTAPEQRSTLPGDGMPAFLRDLEASWMKPGAESDRLVHSLSKFLKRPYWRRIWIVQEVLANAQLQFVCGREKVADEPMHAAIRLIRNLNDHLEATLGRSWSEHLGRRVDTSLLTPSAIILFKIRRAGGALPLIYLLRTLRKIHASDPRDKIFGILGMARDAEELGLVPDYSLSCIQVYTNVASAFLKAGYLEILSLCSSSPRSLQLPSWVPDWSAKTDKKNLQERSLDRRSGTLSTELQPRFQAGASSMPSELNFSEDGSVLTISAVRIGKVTLLARRWNPNAPHQWIHDLFRMSAIAGVPQEGVWRTAVTDQAVRTGSANVKPRVSAETIAKVTHAMRDAFDLDSVYERLVDAGLGGYVKQMAETASNRVPFLLDDRYIGIGPVEAVVGDEVYIVPGAPTPHVVRKTSSGDDMTLLGEVYLHGMMDGEAFDSAHDTTSMTLA